MAQSGNINIFQTVSTVHYTGTIAQNAGATEDILVTAAGAGVRCRIRSLCVYSVQNLAWEIQFYGAEFATGSAASIDSENFLGRWTFQVGDGVQGPTDTAGGSSPANAVGGNYFYYIDGLDIAYEDRDTTPIVGLGPAQGAAVTGGAVGTSTLHMALVNRSATGKLAGGPGGIVIRVAVESTLGWA
jgi:hypothetical protein